MTLLASATTILLSCADKQSPIHLSFVSTWQDRAIDCSSKSPALTDLRFYVSDVSLLDASGGAHKLEMTDDGRWQESNIALLDLENAESRCNNGSTAINASIRGTAQAAEYVGLRFTVGVPFEQNHLNPLLAAAPLNDAAMHWHWRSGYKFLRAGVSSDDDGFWVHLGSTGCEGSVQHISGCTSPNRVTIELPEFSPHRDSIAIDLAALLRGVDLTDGAPGDCSSGPAETGCAAPFLALGLPFAGQVAESQSVFKALP